MNIDPLIAIVGPDAVVTDPERLGAHTRDWTGRWKGTTPAVLFPSSTAQVAAIVAWCAESGTALVPQGGNTGMVGGGVPLGGEVVLNLTRLDGLDVDAEAGVVVAGAGATLAAVQNAARDAGWMYGVDLGARDSATIGGTVATNAGGLHVIRHGDTRHQLLGIEAVTGTGEIVGDLRGLHKDNTGYHLPSLLAGSEGTLAVITRVCLRLCVPPAETAVALLAFDTEPDAFAAVGPIRRGVTDLQALEIVFASGVDLVCETFDLAPPFPVDPARPAHAAYLLVEAAGAPGMVDRLGEAVTGVSAAVADAAVATTDAQRSGLWRYREAHTEAISLRCVPHKLDVTIPLDAMNSTVAEIRSAVANHSARTDPGGAELWLFGHAGDGNLHVNITGVNPDDHALDRRVLEIVADAGGSISAEHGIGRAKTRDLFLNRTPSEIALATQLKAAFDPAGILNPGVIVET